jgi:hypothetical protein
MYLCNEIIKLLNGKIELSSEEKKGTDILIQIPTLDPTSETLQGKLMQTDVKYYSRISISDLFLAPIYKTQSKTIKKLPLLEKKEEYLIRKNFIYLTENQKITHPRHLYTQMLSLISAKKIGY